MPPLTSEISPDKTRAVPDDQSYLPGYIRDLFREARTYRAPLVAEWNRNYSLLHNRTWGRRPDHLPSPEIAEIWPIVAGQVGWMTDQRPEFQYSPVSSRQSPMVEYMSVLADDLGYVTSALWNSLNFDGANEQMLWDTCTTGTGFLKTLWDPRRSKNLGDPIMRRVDPYTFLVDPSASSMEDANYFIEARIVSLQEVDRRFPGSFERLAYGASRDDIDESPNRVPSWSQQNHNNPIVVPPGTTPTKSSTTSTTPSMSRWLYHKGVTVYEAWLRQHEFVDGETRDFWRCVIVAGNIVLMDRRADKLWNHGQHPYDKTVLVDTGEFWGQSLVGLLASPQIELNRLLAAISQNVFLTGNPVMLDYAGSGISRGQITNRAGQRLTATNPSMKPEWLVPPQIQNQMPRWLMAHYTSRMENVSGLPASNRGQALPGRNSGEVVNTIQDAGFNRVRLALRNWERCLVSSGYKFASMIAQFYDEPRWIALAGQDGTKQFREFRRNHFHVPGPDGYGPMDFGLTVDAGSSLPTSRQALAALAVTLFGMGAIDRQDLLSVLNWPNRFQTLQRVNSLEAVGQFAAPGARASARA